MAPDDRLLDLLVEQLRYPDLHEQTVKAIVSFGDRCNSRLAACIAAPDYDVREGAADAFESLGRLGLSAVPELKKLLASDQPLHVQVSAARALGGVYAGLVPDPDAEATLKGAMKDPDPEVKAAAAAALVRIGSISPDAVRALASGLKFKETLGFQRAADALAMAWKYQLPNSEVSDNPQLLGEIVNDLTRRLAEKASKDNWKAQRSAADALRRITFPTGASSGALVDKLRELNGDALRLPKGDEEAISRALRRSTADALAYNYSELPSVPYTRAVAELAKLLEAHESPEIKRSGLDALNRILPPLPKARQGFLPSFIALTAETEDSWVRQSAAYAVGDSGDGSADVVDALKGVVQDPEPGVCRAGLAAVRMLRIVSLNREIAELLGRSQSSEVRRACVETLNAIAVDVPPDAAAALAATLCGVLGDASRVEQENAIAGLLSLGQAAVSPLVAVLADRSAAPGDQRRRDFLSRARIAAATALGRMPLVVNGRRTHVEVALPLLAQLLVSRANKLGANLPESLAAAEDHVFEVCEEAFKSICQRLADGAKEFRFADARRVEEAVEEATAALDKCAAAAVNGARDALWSARGTLGGRLAELAWGVGEFVRDHLVESWLIGCAACWLVCLAVWPGLIYRASEAIRRFASFEFTMWGLQFPLHLLFRLATLVKFFEYWPRVLAAWAGRYAEKANDELGKRIAAIRHQVNGAELVRYVGRNGKSKFKELGALSFDVLGQERCCLLITGARRSGRTALAYEIARRAMIVPESPATPVWRRGQQNPLGRLAIPAIVDLPANAFAHSRRPDLVDERAELVERAQAAVKHLLSLKSAPSKGLFNALLRDRRVLMVVRCSAEQHDMVRALVEHHSFPANALVLISPAKEHPLSVNAVVEPATIPEGRLAKYVETQLHDMAQARRENSPESGPRTGRQTPLEPARAASTTPPLDDLVAEFWRRATEHSKKVAADRARKRDEGLYEEGEVVPTARPGFPIDLEVVGSWLETDPAQAPAAATDDGSWFRELYCDAMARAKGDDLARYLAGLSATQQKIAGAVRIAKAQFDATNPVLASSRDEARTAAQELANALAQL